jgi:hypothetical protein
VTPFVHSIKGLVDDGTADSLTKAIIGIDRLRRTVVQDQFLAALDETCSVDPDIN